MNETIVAERTPVVAIVANWHRDGVRIQYTASDCGDLRPRVNWASAVNHLRIAHGLTDQHAKRLVRHAARRLREDTAAAS